MGLIYGNTTWTVCLATAESSGVPAGDYIYFFTQQHKTVGDLKDSVSELPGGTVMWTPLRKTSQTFNFIGQTPTLDEVTLNYYRETLAKWQKTQSTPLYLFVQRTTGSTTTTVSFVDKDGITQAYMRCIITHYEIEEQKDRMSIAVNLKEVNVP